MKKKKKKQKAKKAAGTLKNWASKFERKAFIKGFLFGLETKIK